MGSYLDDVLKQLQALPQPKGMSVPGGTPNGGLINQMFDAQQQANAANSQRFNIAAGLLSKQGTAAKADVAQQASKSSADMNQGLMNRGLYNTTVFSPLQAGITREANRQNEKIDESTAGGLANLIGERNDQGPNMGLLSSLLSNSQKPVVPQIGNATTAGFKQPGAALDANSGIPSAPAAARAPTGGYVGGGGNNNYSPSSSYDIPMNNVNAPGVAPAGNLNGQSAASTGQVYGPNDGISDNGGLQVGAPLQSSMASPFDDIYNGLFGAESTAA